MKSIAFATIQELLAAYEAKKVTPEEVLADTIARFEKYDTRIGAALEVFDKKSILSTAPQSGVLRGIPGIIKDNICQKGRITSCASKILENYRAPYDATAIKRLKQEGALLVGRANCDEFAMGSSTETSAYQKTYNPWDVSKVPGGSSGGSIAAVAAGLVPWSLGSETGGSVRLPAAFCGIVGFKPTYGLISRFGLVAYASSTDQIGIATRTVKDCALVLNVIAGPDVMDATTVQKSLPDYAKTLDGHLPAGIRIGVVKNALDREGIDPLMHKAFDDSLQIFKNLGASICEVSLPSIDYGAAIYFIVSRAEAASNLARFDGVRYGVRDASAQTLASMYQQTRMKGFGTEVKARIMIGNYVLSAGHAADFYVNARKARQYMTAQIEHAFKEVDVLLTPTAPGAAFAFNAFDNNKLQMDLQDYFTCPASLAGTPAISVPCGVAQNGLPLGLQIMGPRLAEDMLLKVAHAYEQAAGWYEKKPKGFE